MARSYKRDARGRFATGGGGLLGRRRARKYNRRTERIDFLQGVIREDSKTARGPINEIYRQGYPSRSDYSRGVKMTRDRVVKLRAKQVKASRKLTFV